MSADNISGSYALPPRLMRSGSSASSTDLSPNCEASFLSNSGSRRMRMHDEIVSFPYNNANNSMIARGEHVENALELEDFLYNTSRRGHNSHKFRSPVGLIVNFFTCWCKNRPHSRTFSTHPGLRSFPAAALLEQNRIQQEALVESQETRDMWEWQMEQQRFITCQEHDLLEKNSLEMNPLLGHVPDLARIASQLIRNASIRSEQELKDEVMEEKEKNSPSSREVSPSWELASPSRSDIWNSDPDFQSAMMLLFEATLLRCRSEINFFCRVFMQQMVLSGYSLIRTLQEMEPNTVFLKKVHASYALESRINNALFRCFENDSFDETGLTQIFDPTLRAAARLQDYLRMRNIDSEDALNANNPAYEPSFHTFCANKSEEVMAMFSWSMGYRSTTERDRFMEAFLRAAKWVWLLHRLANASNPPVQIIRVGRGQEVDPVYLEPVALPPLTGCERCSNACTPTVEFMVLPGFITSQKVFRCKVYQHYQCEIPI